MTLVTERVLVKRLSPGDDFKAVLDKLPVSDNIKSGVLLSVVGSFTVGKLRMAGANGATEIKGPLEIVSGTGTVGESGIHVHLSLSDADGKTVGGHLMPGCLVYTTVELAVLDLSGSWNFERKLDSKTGYPELAPHEIFRDID